MNSLLQKPDTIKSRLGIRRRLIAGFAAVAAIFLISALMTVYFIRAAQVDSDYYLNSIMPARLALMDLQAEIVDVELSMQSVVFYQDIKSRETMDQQLKIINTLKGTIDKQVSDLKNTLTTEKWSKLISNLTDYQTKIAVLYKLIDENTHEKALEYYKAEILPLTIILNDSINVDLHQDSANKGILDHLGEVMTDNMAHISSQLSIILITTLVFMLFSLFISYLIATKTSKSILDPLFYAISIAKSIAEGRRNVEITIERNDESGQLLESLAMMRDSIKASEDKIQESAAENKRLFDSVVKSANLFSQHASRVSSGELTDRLDLSGSGIEQDIMLKLGKDLNSMTDNLSSVTSDIINACSSMVSTLDEVRHAVDAQSSGASEQASSINQITASITEIEKSASQTMNKAQDLGGVAERTRQNGQLGLESIQASVTGMKSVRDRVQLIAQTILDLSRQTQQVGEITAVVNNLAQQSKMLALNASIEAAKAGDAGKGFAVVASEVKNLAEQSEQSTSQVQKILEDIKIATEKAVMVTEEGTKGVDSGLEMIERTGEIIRNLNDVIREAAIASQQIESAVRQESAGIEQITAGMNEINTVTSSFVESVGQTTEAMDNLSNVTRKLKSSVETYKV